MKTLVTLATLLALSSFVGVASASPIDISAHGRIHTTIHFGTPCPGSEGEAVGCTSLGDHGANVWIGDGDPDTLIHELGHVFDMQVMNPASRATFKRYIGPRTRTWFPVNDGFDGVRDLGTEIFADAFATCVLRPWVYPPDGFWTTYDYDPGSTRVHRQVCRLIQRVANER